MHVVWMRYNDELGPSFTLWDKPRIVNFFCQNDADMCRRLKLFVFPKLRIPGPNLKRSNLEIEPWLLLSNFRGTPRMDWYMQAELSTIWTQVTPLPRSYVSWPLWRLLRQNYNNQYAVGGEEAFSRMVSFRCGVDISFKSSLESSPLHSIT